MHSHRPAADRIRKMSDKQLERWLLSLDDLFIRRALTGSAHACAVIMHRLLVAEGERRMEEQDECMAS